MSFEHVMTIVAIAAALGGTWLGHFLSQRSSTAGYEREAKRTAQESERERAIRLAVLARQVVFETGSVAYGLHLTHNEDEPIKGLDEGIFRYNDVQDEFQTAVLQARVLGPSWAVSDAEVIEVTSARAADLIADMRHELDEGIYQRLESEVAELDKLTGVLVARLSEHYNPDAASLAPRINIGGRLRRSQ